MKQMLKTWLFLLTMSLIVSASLTAISAGLRERLRFSNVPPVLGQTGIVMIVTGIMAMAFIGFAGMISL
ncbi:MAG TPA: hypothetical protein ENN97_07870 [Phycisphaerales bacterium]|nr:hypothetical protein [Phycisphaerales bacterium]